MNSRSSAAAAYNSTAPLLTFIKDRLYFTCLQSAPVQRADLYYFTIDQLLVYQHFYADFGPLNLAQTLRFCSLMRQLLQQPELANKKLIMYSSFAPDKKANALFVLCAFMMLVNKNSPEQSCQPITSIADTIVPFRDAGYGPDTYQLSILDCLKGLQKAMDHKLIDLNTMDLAEYEYYEKVDHGDMNWLVCDKFLAFATPHDDPPQRDPTVYPKTAQHPNNENILPHGIPWRLNDYINYFKKNKVSTVIRLNHKVYDRQRFVEQGIEHIELYFHDGSCPSMEILNAFLEIVESNRCVAVHCKAGLGRTGSLIAAYLMKHYHFTAAEIIGYLRVIRPGSVVGPQQNWLQSMQSTLWAMGTADTHSHLKESLSNVQSGRQYVLAPTTAPVGNTFAARLAKTSQQKFAVESAVPATATTLIDNHVVSIPVQPRKAADTLTPASSFLQAVEQLLIDDNQVSTENSSPIFGESKTNSAPYNLRASTIAARSTPSSRSNSITFDPFTPRSTSNASLKLKTIVNKVSGTNLARNAANGLSLRGRKDAAVVRA